VNGMTCAELAEKVRASDPSRIASISCMDDSANCNCSLTGLPQTSSETGTYVVAGNSITTTPGNGSAPESGQFCVDGSQLSLRTTGSAPIVILATK
jgi:hypothetical protein